MSEYEETVENPNGVGGALTDEEIQDFIDRGGEMPTYHPILQIWREVLSNAEGELHAKVTPQWANRITSSYRELNFADMERFRDLLFTRIMELASVVESAIDSDEECLNYTSPEEDVEHNSQHYRDILTGWQVVIVGWEKDWECTSPDAAIDLASISEIHKMFFGSPQAQGLTAYLENIKFEYTEADVAALAEALENAKAG